MKTDPLAGHLAKIYCGDGGSFGWDNASNRIRRDPQTHMAALVEADVLWTWYDDNSDEDVYSIKPVKTKTELANEALKAFGKYLSDANFDKWAAAKEAYDRWENATS